MADRSLYPETESGEDWRRKFVLNAAVKVLSQIRKTSVDEVRGEIIKSAVTPMKAADYPGSSVVRIMDLAPGSAISEFAGLVTKVDLTGISSFSMPMAASLAAAKFIGEDQPIPVVDGDFSGTLVGPIRKLALVSMLSNELETATLGLASIAIGRTLANAVGVGGAQIIFSNAAGVVDVSPAGLMHGVMPVAGSADPAADIKALIGEIAAAGISTKSVVLLCASAQYLSLSMLNWPKFSYRVIEVHTLPEGTVIAVATDGVIMAGDGVPSIDTRRQTTLHMANPAAPIVPPGGPMSSPVTSSFQTDSFALRCIARLTWAVIPGAIAWTDSATW